MRFSGKVALVTGASGGIGQAIAHKLRDQDAIVITTDRENADICGDLMDQTFCDRLPAQVIKIHGQLDILVNNAGVITRVKINEARDDDFAHTMAINVEAPFRLCRAAIGIMANAGGRCDRQYSKLLGAPSRAGSSDLCHVKSGNCIAYSMSGA